MTQTFDDWQLEVQLLAKVEQCRRLARQVTDPLTARRLLDLAEEYVSRIRNTSSN